MSQNTQDPGLRAALWCMHVAGPDDVHAAPDFWTALSWAAELNGFVAKRAIDGKWAADDNWPLTQATVKPWPYTAEEHGWRLAKELADRAAHEARRATPAHAPGKAGDWEGLRDLVDALLQEHDELVREEVNDSVKEHDTARFDRAYAAVLALAPSPTGNEAPRGNVPAGWKLVPEEATEAMWSGLARQIVMWARGSRPTGHALHRDLKNCGWDIPEWLKDEIEDADYVPPKGAVAVVIYRAMLAAAPPPPVSTEPDSRAGAVKDALRPLVYELSGGGEFFLDRCVAALAALHPSPPTASGAAAPVGERVIPLPKPSKDQQDYLSNIQVAVSDYDPDTVIRGHDPDATPTPAPPPVTGTAATRNSAAIMNRLHQPPPTPTLVPHSVSAKDDL